MKKEPFIDIEKIIREKNPRLLKWMPGFLLRYVKRILHQKEVNAFMEINGKLRDLDFINAVLSEFNTKVIVKGIEHLPEQGGFILASNHPLGGFDGLALMQAVSHKRKDIQFLVNDILLHFGTMDNLFVPVNKHGSQHSISRIEETYKSENAVLIFPAGLVSRKQSGKIMDLEWKKSFIAKSIQYHKPIVPAYIDGKNSSFFYNLALWRKRLGIKANIEMFYLMDEMYKQRNKTITITFDHPVHPSVFDQEKSHRELAALMKSHVYAMGEGKPGPFSKNGKI
ncbi:MAG TPA: 1-acyl-sn-glycerol-3-phosphate acyltransferase [Bacteroidia bacterium]|nr:1-acyl-sn-glycerol-3-phosphate acyltransferase [Bacteroidia bacterium]